MDNNQRPDTNSDSAESKQNSDSEFGLFKFSAAAVAALSLTLILLGFGVSLAVESRLALPHSSLYESSVELLDLGSVAVIEILPKLFKNLGEIRTYLDMILHMWGSLWYAIAFYVLAVVVVFYLKYVRKVDFKAKKDEAKAFLGQGNEKGFVVRACLFLLLFLAGLLSPVIVYFSLALGMLVLAFVPMLGWMAGLAYIDEVAMNDRACAPLPSVQIHLARKAQQASGKSAEAKDEPELAQCVKVSKDGEEISGRLVLSTSKAVVLYLPNGKARRVPLGDALVEVIDQLPEDQQDDTPKKPEAKGEDKTS